MVNKFGFDFGSMRVTRVARDGKTGIHIISVKTNKYSLSVRATKTGLLSFYDKNGYKLSLVDSEYLQQKQAELDTADVLHFDEVAELKAEITVLKNKLKMKRCN